MHFRRIKPFYADYYWIYFLIKLSNRIFLVTAASMSPEKYHIEMLIISNIKSVIFIQSIVNVLKLFDHEENSYQWNDNKIQL